MQTIYFCEKCKRKFKSETDKNDWSNQCPNHEDRCRFCCKCEKCQKCKYPFYGDATKPGTGHQKCPRCRRGYGDDCWMGGDCCECWVCDACEQKVEAVYGSYYDNDALCKPCITKKYPKDRFKVKIIPSDDRYEIRNAGTGKLIDEEDDEP